MLDFEQFLVEDEKALVGMYSDSGRTPYALGLVHKHTKEIMHMINHIPSMPDCKWCKLAKIHKYPAYRKETSDMLKQMKDTMEKDLADATAEDYIII